MTSKVFFFGVFFDSLLLIWYFLICSFFCVVTAIAGFRAAAPFAGGAFMNAAAFGRMNGTAPAFGGAGTIAAFAGAATPGPFPAIAFASSCSSFSFLRRSLSHYSSLACSSCWSRRRPEETSYPTCDWRVPRHGSQESN